MIITGHGRTAFRRGRSEPSDQDFWTIIKSIYLLRLQDKKGHWENIRFPNVPFTIT